MVVSGFAESLIPVLVQLVMSRFPSSALVITEGSAETDQTEKKITVAGGPSLCLKVDYVSTFLQGTSNSVFFLSFWLPFESHEPASMVAYALVSSRFEPREAEFTQIHESDLAEREKASPRSESNSSREGPGGEGAGGRDGGGGVSTRVTWRPRKRIHRSLTFIFIVCVCVFFFWGVLVWSTACLVWSTFFWFGVQFFWFVYFFLVWSTCSQGRTGVSCCFHVLWASEAFCRFDLSQLKKSWPREKHVLKPP